MEERNENIIERFFRNELTAAERVAFEGRLLSDTSFQEEVELHRKARQAIRLQEKSNLLKKLSERGKQLDAQKPSYNTLWWWLGGSAILLLLFFCWVKWNNPSSSNNQNLNTITKQDSTQLLIPVDTVPSNKPIDTLSTQKQQKERPIASIQEKQDRLFAQYFKPYQDETLEPSVRGEGAVSPSDKFQQLYLDGKYVEAVAQFENLSSLAKNNDNNLFVKAECLLAIGDASAAAAVYEAILQNDRSRFMDATSLHLALAYLKLGALEKAKKQLGYISRELDPPWQQDADAILKALQ